MPVVSFEKYDLQHTRYGESGNHTGECYQSLIGRYVGYLTEITGGPVIAYSFNAALKEKNEAEQQQAAFFQQV